MKKYEPMKKDLSADIDVRRLSDEVLSFALKATPEQNVEIATLYDIPTLRSFTVKGRIIPGDIVTIRGTLDVDMDRVCVVTNEVFSDPIKAPFVLLFSESPETADPKVVDVDLEGEPIETIRHHRIFLKDVLVEQFGLNLNPFPKKTSEPFVYKDSDETPTENPFSVLKKLTNTKKTV